MFGVECVHQGVYPGHGQGHAKMTTHSCLLTFPVPAAVTNLKITENSTRHLSFSWTASEGELSWYNIFLYNPDKTLQERAQVDPLVQSFSFQNLLQGRMYKLVIVTHSGELSNESFIFGRTGKTRAVMAWEGGVMVSHSTHWLSLDLFFLPYSVQSGTLYEYMTLKLLPLTQTRHELCLLSLLASVALSLFICRMEFVENEPTSSTCQ